MRLDQSTWPEVEAYLRRSRGIIIPTGSTEQHGPMGLIGTDALCAQDVAEGAALIADACVAPTLAYTPAPFNMAFPGTISISEPVFEAFVSEILKALLSHGFDRFYLLNGHGANLAPLGRVAHRLRSASPIEQDFPTDRRHAPTILWRACMAPRIAITQATHPVKPGAAATPSQKLSAEYIHAHAGDRHGPPTAISRWPCRIPLRPTPGVAQGGSRRGQRLR